MILNSSHCPRNMYHIIYAQIWYELCIFFSIFLDSNQPFSWNAEILEPFKMKLIWRLGCNLEHSLKLLDEAWDEKYTLFPSNCLTVQWILKPTRPLAPSPAHPGLGGRCTSVRIGRCESTKQVEPWIFLESTIFVDSRKLLHCQSRSHTRDIYHLFRFRESWASCVLWCCQVCSYGRTPPGLLPCKRPCIDVCASRRLLNLALLAFGDSWPQPGFMLPWSASILCSSARFHRRFATSFGGWKYCSGWVIG